MTGLWKAWENDKTVFPPFPQPLEIADRDFHITHGHDDGKRNISQKPMNVKSETMMHNTTTQVGQIR